MLIGSGAIENDGLVLFQPCQPALEFLQVIALSSMIVLQVFSFS